MLISLIAAPGRLSPETAETVRSAFGGAPLRWLSPREAAEFAVPARPDTLTHVRAEMGLMGIDLNALPGEGRRKRLLLADMDSTMIGQECIDELADVAGVGKRVAEITARAMNGETSFDGALEERLALLKGLPETAIAEVVAERITFASGGATLIATMKAHGARAFLVSGGFTAFTSHVARALGFDDHRANVLEVADGRLLGTARAPYLGREAKVETLESEVAAMGIRVDDVLAVGDGANDLGMIGRAGMGVALHAKPAVRDAAPLAVDHGDLTALLFLQGYERAAFTEVPDPA